MPADLLAPSQHTHADQRLQARMASNANSQHARPYRHVKLDGIGQGLDALLAQGIAAQLQVCQPWVALESCSQACKPHSHSRPVCKALLVTVKGTWMAVAGSRLPAAIGAEIVNHWQKQQQLQVRLLLMLSAEV